MHCELIEVLFLKDIELHSNKIKCEQEEQIKSNIENDFEGQDLSQTEEKWPSTKIVQLWQGWRKVNQECQGNGIFKVGR